MIEFAATAAEFARLYEGAESVLKIGAWECDLATDRLQWTPNLYDMFDLPRGRRVERHHVLDLYDPASRADVDAARSRAIETGLGFTLEAALVLRPGTTRWIRIAAQVARTNGRSVRLFGGKQDVTEERSRWEMLRLRAERDPLTGLANRDLFERRLRTVLSGDDHVALAALLIVDMDHFKRINDRFGHAAGDFVLCETARRLCRAFPDALVVARIGGDEFAVLLGAPLSDAQLRRVAARAVRDLRQPAAWHGQPVDLSASIGIASKDATHRLARDVLFAQADAALYAVKMARRGTYRVAEGVATEP